MSTNAGSVGPETPELEFLKCIGNIGIRGGGLVFDKAIFSHFVNVVFIVTYCNYSQSASRMNDRGMKIAFFTFAFLSLIG